jgi:hypothetical protein
MPQRIDGLGGEFFVNTPAAAIVRLDRQAPQVRQDAAGTPTGCTPTHLAEVGVVVAGEVGLKGVPVLVEN